MDADSDVKRLHCLHDRRQTEKPSSHVVTGTIKHFKAFRLHDTTAFLFLQKNEKISHANAELLLHLLLIRKKR